MLDKHKVSCFAGWPYVIPQPYKVLTQNQISNYDLVVCCADNLAVRQMLYKTGMSWLDLRAQGRNGLLVSYEEDPNILSMLDLTVRLVAKVIVGMVPQGIFTLPTLLSLVWEHNGFSVGLLVRMSRSIFS